MKSRAGKTGLSRPAFAEMIAAVKRGEISELAVCRLDRVSRSTTDLAGIMDLLEKYNVSFVSATEKFDT
ncbi:MAG: recombinase family protein [Clostridiales bacterium]|nr:recombinase family protein [Clostridiales bacterium]